MRLPDSIVKKITVKKLTWWICVFAFVFCGIELSLQYIESREVRSIAQKIIAEKGAYDSRSKVIALRDYLRQNVRWQEAPYENRSFLRSTTIETIQSGKGYCGEVTRAFINLAAAVGVNAQRINLWGSDPHVVAEARLSPNDRVIVDCQNPPHIADLESLDQVILRPEYDEYYTLNLRRLHLNWLVTRVRLKIGFLTYWLENPHALKATFWFLLALSVLTLKGLRRLVRWGLKKRGWVHITDQESLAFAQRRLPFDDSDEKGKSSETVKLSIEAPSLPVADSLSRLLK